MNILIKRLTVISVNGLLFFILIFFSKCNNVRHEIFIQLSQDKIIINNLANRTVIIPNSKVNSQKEIPLLIDSAINKLFVFDYCYKLFSFSLFDGKKIDSIDVPCFANETNFKLFQLNKHLVFASSSRFLILNNNLEVINSPIDTIFRYDFTVRDFYNKFGYGFNKNIIVFSIDYWNLNRDSLLCKKYYLDSNFKVLNLIKNKSEIKFNIPTVEDTTLHHPR